jgi:hypothetical protein
MSQHVSQLDACKRFGSVYLPPSADEHLGIALSSLGKLPLNALRHPPESGTCGWYVWGGEFSDDPEFFQSLHVLHMPAHAAPLVPYLALAPGWRVLLAPGQVDVWYDPALLSV